MLPELLRKVLLESVTGKRLGADRDEYGLLTLSLPLPRGCPADSFRVGDGAGCAIGLGRWPGGAAGHHRRALLIADNPSAGAAPQAVSITEQGTRGPDAPAGSAPTTELVPHHRAPDPMFLWEQHAVRIGWRDHSLDLILGLRTRGEIHWWEACRLVRTECSGACTVAEIGGVIPVDTYGPELMKEFPGYKHPYLHRHNWLSGHVYARLHHNGVVEIFARHTNSKFVDDGLPFDDVVPVIGIRVDGQVPGGFGDSGAWDGTRNMVSCGDVRFDMTDAAPLATVDEPGRAEEEDGFLVWQPYGGVELFSGIYGTQTSGDPFIFRASEKHYPRGMTRTIRFRVSLNPARSPRMARYLAPAWWYGACEEFSAEPLLPVSNEADRLLDHFAQAGAGAIHKGGFEDGSLPRGMRPGQTERPEPGWEGETAYGLMLNAWRTGDAAVYDAALRASIYFTDVCIDHAAKQVRMHGYPPNAFALPMARVLSPVGVWLETGDPYFLNAARAVVETAHWTELNSWPRLAVGRDACYLKSAVLLYRYLGCDRYREIAREGIDHVCESQREDGSFGDQGGGARVHQWGGYITKPWMAYMATGGVLDYLEMFPDDPVALETVKRLADWFRRERFTNAQGKTGWCYQHGYNGGRVFRDFLSGKVTELKGPQSKLWHAEYMARFFMFCAKAFDDPWFFTAWRETCRHYYPDSLEGLGVGDHSTAQALQYVPRLQAWLWNARLAAEGVVAEPVWAGPETPCSGTVMAPGGDRVAHWRDGGGGLQENPFVRCDVRLLGGQAEPEDTGGIPGSPQDRAE